MSQKSNFPDFITYNPLISLMPTFLKRTFSTIWPAIRNTWRDSGVTPWAIVDTGPLVAFLDRRERHHTWAVEQMRELNAPLFVCEPVLTEAMFLLSHLPQARTHIDSAKDTGGILSHGTE